MNEAGSAVSPGWIAWTPDEKRRLDAIIRERAIDPRDADAFPGRTIEAVLRQASKRRKKLGIAQAARGRPCDDGARERNVPSWQDKAAASSDALLRATVAMCVRRGITLPGMSPGHTRALAINLGLAA